jgi:glucan endo-1,3-alpha-glucosidase
MVMATQPSTVLLSTDPNLAQKSNFDVPAGVSRLSIPISPGGAMYGAIMRGTQTIVELRPQNFSFNGNPVQYNFNVFIAGAQAPSQQ